MNEVSDIRRLLDEVAERLPSSSHADMSVAVAKLERIVAIASTLAFTIQARRK
jgi:hypothetical protein